METRRSSQKKRKAEEDGKNRHVQNQLFKTSNFVAGPSDIIIDQNLMKQEVIVVKQEPHLDQHISDNDVKLEIEDQKVVIVTEEETLCSDYEETKIFTDKGNQKSHCALPEEDELKSENTDNRVFCIEKSLPHILQHLEVNDILLCRQICKNWRLVVDNFLEIKTIEAPYDNEAYLITMQRFPVEQMLMQKYRRIKYSYYFAILTPTRPKSSNLYKFMNKMGKYHGSGLSPLIGGGRVCLENYLFDEEEDEEEDEGELAEEFLEKFGNNIHYLKIKESDLPFEKNTSDFVERITKYLRYTPNLKQFTIRFTKFRCTTEYFRKRAPPILSKAEALCLTDEQLRQLSSALPPHLESFCLSVNQGLLVPNLLKVVGTEIIKYYERKLQKLVLPWPNNWNFKMSELKELTFCLLGHSEQDYTFFHFHENPDLRLFRYDNFLGANVEKLHFKTVSNQQLQMADLLKIIEMLPSVQYLKLSYLIWANLIFDNLSHFPSNNIHTLELTNFYGISGVPYNLFRAFQKLRYFKLRLNWMTGYNTKETTDITSNLIPETLFIAPKISIYETQLWEILPGLEMVAIQFHNHTCNVFRNHPCGWEPGCRYYTQRCQTENVVATRLGYLKYIANMS